MPVPAADLISARSDLFSEAEIQESQQLGPVPNSSRAGTHTRERDAARETSGRFAKGHSGNPAGRPRGIRNPRRRPLGLLLRQAKPGTLVPLIERKSYLRLPVLRLVLPPPARPDDPGTRLGIDFSRMPTPAAVADGLRRVFDAVCHSRITPGDAVRLSRRGRRRLRELRRAVRVAAALRDGRALPLPRRLRPIRRAQRRLARLESLRPEGPLFSAVAASRSSSDQRLAPDPDPPRAQARESRTPAAPRPGAQTAPAGTRSDRMEPKMA